MDDGLHGGQSARDGYLNLLHGDIEDNTKAGKLNEADAMRHGLNRPTSCSCLKIQLHWQTIPSDFIRALHVMLIGTPYAHLMIPVAGY